MLDAPRLVFATFLVDVVGAFFNDREARTIRAFSRGLTPWGYVTLRILLLAPLACCSAASAAVAVCREASPDTGRASLPTVSYARSSRLSGRLVELLLWKRAVAAVWLVASFSISSLIFFYKMLSMLLSVWLVAAHARPFGTVTSVLHY